ncbi:MAG: OmpA family protein [Cytophagaceae bacterium]|nr:OmpA family protein [Cytophagaceae bacterium]
MAKNWILVLLIPLVSSCGFINFPQSGGQPQQQPNRNQMPAEGNDFGHITDKGTSIERVELTDQYTIVYMHYENRNRMQRDRTGKVIYTGQERIGFHPTSQLYALGGSRTFQFVRAEGIPYHPKYTDTRPGDEADFVIYYERLDPGIEHFDLFECNDSDQYVCWNFYDVKVRNPAPTPPPSRPRAPEPGTKPVPQTKPQKTPVPAKPAPVPVVTDVLVRGIVSDVKTRKPVSATLNFLYSLNKKVIDSLQSFPQNGEYRMKLTPGYVYQITASAKGYLVQTEIVDLTKTTGLQQVTKNIELRALAVGDKVTLKNIYFEATKSDLLKASFAELDNLVTLMTDNPTMEIRLEGHTDVIGDHAANLKLSEDRVAEVRRYLVRKGIEAERIQATGYGDTRPLVAKGTDEQRKVNRRVEFAILQL